MHLSKKEMQLETNIIAIRRQLSSVALKWYMTSPSYINRLLVYILLNDGSLTHIQTEKISSWNGPTIHVCCFMLVRASTKTFISRNVISHRWSGVSLLAVSNVNNPVGLVGLPCVMQSAHFFVTHILTEKISSWNGPTIHVCCFMLARASTKTFVSRVRKTAKKIFVSKKIR
jgi:hypothetical protein